jgi:starvation-inducible DNA-binding protein
MKTTSDYTEKLNALLATYQIHYQNLRSLHWNVKGENFFELHLKYEELYTRVQEIIDEIAERILSLGSGPMHKLYDYLSNSRLKENETITQGKEGISYILSAQKEILGQERELLALSAEIDDEGTNSLMSDYIREKEKTNWMLAAWLDR